jgi:hypothetical protein
MYLFGHAKTWRVFHLKLVNIILNWIPQYQLVHQTRYWLNPNYVVIVKQNIDELLTANFIKPVENTTRIHDLLKGSSWLTYYFWPKERYILIKGPMHECHM